MSFVTLSTVSILIWYFPYWKILCLSSIFLKLLLRNYVADFVEICNVCARKATIEAAKRIINSDKVCHSYSDLNFGVTFLEHSVYCLATVLDTGDVGLLMTIKMQSVLLTRLTSCKRYVLRKRIWHKLTLLLSQFYCAVYFCQVLCCLCFILC